MASYRRLLRDVDRWYGRIRSSHPDKVTCTRGCRDCCLGLFNITIADRELLRAGLGELDPATRSDIERRSTEILGELRKQFPTLGTTLTGHTDDEIDAICDHLGAVECPVLGSEGECRLYAHRPLTCRLAGVPVVDVSGEVIASKGCSKCTLTSSEALPLDCTDIRRREQRCLETLDPTEPNETLLIPQALESSHTE